jgi:UDP-3-O-[3-hydroxymyristoyl] glucosamine N-acyltransferase
LAIRNIHLGSPVAVSLDSITEVIRAKNINIDVKGPQNAVEKMAAIAPDVENSLCYYIGNNPEHLAGIKSSIIICKPGLEVESGNNTYVFTAHPQLVFYYVSSLFGEKPEPKINNSAIVDKNAQIGKGVSIGAFCVIDECMIGENVIIESGVRLYRGTFIGNNVHIQSGTVIGAAGVMWAWDSNGNKVPCVQTGNVIIEDNVTVGSNITIARGAFPNKPTIIGDGTMISHGTMIGHGTVIGASNHFANNVALAGSVTTGKKCFFGSGAVVRPHIEIAPETIIGAGAVVVRDFLEEGQVLVGNPAQPMVKKKNASGVPDTY